METCLIQAPPANITQFVDDMLPEYERIYGKTAALAYRLSAPTQLAATITHPSVRAYALQEEGHTEAMLFVQTTDTRHTLSFFHVLRAHSAENLAPALLQTMLSDIPEEDTRLIISDYIPLGPLELSATYKACGFEAVERQIMRKACARTTTTNSQGYDLRHANTNDILPLAAVLCAAYEEHPENFLYEEVQSKEAAQHFLQQCSWGAFGSCPRDYLIGAWLGSTCVGLIVGAEVVAEMGFVLHMAVLPAHRGRGVGTSLLNTLTARFYDHGMACAALGVTRENPAVHLYTAADFEILQPFKVYYRPRSCTQSSTHTE